MSGKRVLYISGSLGLGHSARDLAIANQLRELDPEVHVTWLAAHPASMVIQEAGEDVHPAAEEYANDNEPAEAAAKEGFRLNLIQYLMDAVGAWQNNVGVFARIVGENPPDLVVADEAYEIGVALAKGSIQLKAPFVMLYDFIGVDPMSWNPKELLGAYMWNREWANIRNLYDGVSKVALFLGELEDIPDSGLGPLLPNRRDLGREVCKFVGYPLQFSPADYADKLAVRSELGYSDEPLVICAIGGTAVGRDLLTLCGQAYPLAKAMIPGLQMVLVCGPRLSVETLDPPEGVQVLGYVPDLYKHFAASDLAIVQGGGTVTLELTALRRPFLYFPLHDHFEQQVAVANRLARHKAGVKMAYAETTPESLAEAIVANLGKEVTWAPISADGARRAAEAMLGLL